MTVTFVDQRDAVYTEHVNRRGAHQRQYDYFGKESAHQWGPEAFLVDYGPERTTTAHFHSVDQFQIFFGAAGSRYQRRPIPAVELHYADAFVTYGPFSAGEERMQFFTLRPCQGQFKGEMPSERDKLEYVGRRRFHVDLEPALSAPLPVRSETRVVIPPEPDGLAATLVSAPAGSKVRLDAHGTSGAYACVLAGAIDHGGYLAGPQALGWIDPADEAVSVTAGPDGARLLVLRYPSPPTPVSRRAGG